MRDDRADGETAPVSPVDGEVAAGLEPGEPVAEPPGTGAEDAVQAELTRLQQETAQLRELYLRKLADFDNFRKRKDKEMSDFRRQANADLVRDLLPVVDNLERAVGVGGEDSGGVRAGVELTLRQLRDVLSRYGVVEVDPGGQPFDPSLHEAVSRLATADVPANTVVQVLAKGYLLGDRLLRAALVVVAAPVAAGAAASAGEEA